MWLLCLQGRARLKVIPLLALQAGFLSCVLVT